MSIATRLKKFPHEIEALSCDEFDRIISFFIYEQEYAPKPKDKKGKLDPNKFIKGPK